MNTELIQPAEVVRGQYGWWEHPQMPDWGDDSDLIPREAWQKWLDDNQAEAVGIDFQWDATQEQQDRYFEDGDPDVSSWEPSKPAGDGWFMLGIWDTEDGPVCWWLRRKEPQA